MEVYYVLSLKTFYILKVQEVIPISSYDTGGTLLLLGCHNGSIYYIGKLIQTISSLSIHLLYDQVCVWPAFIQL